MGVGPLAGGSALARAGHGALTRLRALTPGQVWILLAGLVATHHLLLLQFTQEDIELVVSALLLWGGALICIEDLLPSLRPRPTRWGVLVGALVLVLVLLRSSRISHYDAVVFLFPPLEGMALVLICAPPRAWKAFRASLAILLLMPAYLLVKYWFPELALSTLTAQLTGVLLHAIGVNALVEGRNVALEGGGVSVGNTCSGIGLIVQAVTAAVIFLLAFPLSRWRDRLLVLAAAPVLALMTNVVRIALLALIQGATNFPNKKMVFDFFHLETGSLLFSLFSMVMLAFVHHWLLEQDLQPPLNPEEQDA